MTKVFVKVTMSFLLCIYVGESPCHLLRTIKVAPTMNGVANYFEGIPWGFSHSEGEYLGVSPCLVTAEFSDIKLLQQLDCSVQAVEKICDCEPDM